MITRFNPLFMLVYLLYSFSVLGATHCHLDHAIVSIYAVDSQTGKVLIDQNSEMSLVPASCMKIVTTAAALSLLGEDFRFETYLEYDGFIDKAGTLHGNLYIRGDGDPCLGSNRIDNTSSWKGQINRWINAVKNSPIRKIKGKVIGDASKWEKALAAPGWSWEDLGNAYGAGACALSFNENAYSLFLKPATHIGKETAILRTDPPLPFLKLQNEVKTGPEGSGDRACIYGAEFSLFQFVRGTIPAKVKEFAIKGALPDPPSCCAQLLEDNLKLEGISVDRQSLSSGSRRVALHKTSSPSVKEIVYWTNQKSINLYAEHLLKKMGEVVFNTGSTQAGVRAVTEFWQAQHIDLAGFHMVDGSGLSRSNLITTKQLVQMLLTIKKSNSFPVFYESLPAAGEVKAKSGTMTLIKGYAGYSNTLVFAILVNNCPDTRKMNEAVNFFLKEMLIKGE